MPSGITSLAQFGGKSLQYDDGVIACGAQGLILSHILGTDQCSWLTTTTQSSLPVSSSVSCTSMKPLKWASKLMLNALQFARTPLFMVRCGDGGIRSWSLTRKQEHSHGMRTSIKTWILRLVFASVQQCIRNRRVRRLVHNALRIIGTPFRADIEHHSDSETPLCANVWSIRGLLLEVSLEWSYIHHSMSQGLMAHGSS
jgi:hypothetical protein